MAARKKKKIDLVVDRQENENEEEVLARASINSSLLAACTLRHYTKALGQQDLMSLTNALKQQTAQISENDLTACEAMLMAQATTLEAIYNNLATRAINADLMSQLEVYLKLGLRAQAQSRATIEAIAELKNPRSVAFVKQANIANGPQQVNNASAGNQPSARADEKQKPQNELITEQNHGPQMDFAAAPPASGKDKALGALETLNRAKDT